ncbi:hypothetical protein T12_6259 [Trichinella patagoniensis]|uniref:Uncharacterized protein n=1 Tax=Trichinella patagoniensis TaxID=990121 RepID=A0A0V1A533_9BILA|nr:hypothetical protein T12_6259 [Trichinella patagoniensis]
MFVVHGALTIERAHLVVSTLPAKHSWNEKKFDSLTKGSELLPNIDKNAFIILAVKIRNDASYYVYQCFNLLMLFISFLPLRRQSAENVCVTLIVQKILRKKPLIHAINA